MPYTDPEMHRLYRLARNAKHRKFMQDYKVQAGCVDCGYNDNHAGMEFDHIENKSFNVGNMPNYSMTKILAEIAKCEVVCGTCHNIRTWNRRRAVLDAETLSVLE